MQDFTVEELLSIITNYAELYKTQKARHKYRLVEFMEKRGYEVFSSKENWTGRESSLGKFVREDFTYRESAANQDLFNNVIEKPFEDKEAEFAERMDRIASRIRNAMIYSEKEIENMIAEQAIFIRRDVENEWAEWESKNEIVASYD